MGTTDSSAANTAVKNLQDSSARPSSLTGSVGFGGDNKPDDVRKVSEALVANGKLDTPTSEATDALHSKIITAQQNMADGLKPDGLVKPGGPTENRFTNLVQGGMMKAPTIPRPETGSRAGNAAVAAAGKVGDVDAARTQAFQNASDPNRTSFQQAQDVKRLNTAKDNAAIAAARAEHLDIKRREKTQHDQIMTAQKKRQQTAQQSKQVKDTNTKVINGVDNLLENVAINTSNSHSRTDGSPTDGTQQTYTHRERQIDSRLRGNDEGGERDENAKSDAATSIPDEEFSANRRSAQYLASRTDMQDFPRWEIEDINIQGAPAIAKTADLIEQTFGLDPDQARRLYDRTIIGINPDAQDMLDDILAKTTHGGMSETQSKVPPYSTVYLPLGDSSLKNQADEELSKNQPSTDELVGGQEEETLVGGGSTEWAFREVGKQIDKTIENTRLSLKEGFLNTGAEIGDTLGLDRSAKYLKHFLDGSGKDIVVPIDEARKDPFIRNGEKKNQEEFETKTFLGLTGNDDFNRRLRKIKDGQIIILEDHWDKELPFNKTGFKHIANQTARLLEPDRLFSLGSIDMKSELNGKAYRSGDTIRIEGTVIHNASDDYDFADGDDAYGAYDVQQSGRGKPFKVIQKWPQRVEGTVKILEVSDKGELVLGDPKFTWKDKN